MDPQHQPDLAPPETVATAEPARDSDTAPSHGVADLARRVGPTELQHMLTQHQASTAPASTPAPPVAVRLSLALQAAQQSGGQVATRHPGQAVACAQIDGIDVALDSDAGCLRAQVSMNPQWHIAGAGLTSIRTAEEGAIHAGNYRDIVADLLPDADGRPRCAHYFSEQIATDLAHRRVQLLEAHLRQNLPHYEARAQALIQHLGAGPDSPAHSPGAAAAESDQAEAGAESAHDPAAAVQRAQALHEQSQIVRASLLSDLRADLARAALAQQDHACDDAATQAYRTLAEAIQARAIREGWIAASDTTAADLQPADPTTAQAPRRADDDGDEAAQTVAEQARKSPDQAHGA